MRFKALVADIDGTLLHSGRMQLGQKLAGALAALQRQGVLVILATGRAPHACGSDVLDDFVPDYRVCVNGACILNADSETLYENRFGPGEIEALTRYSEENGYPVCFSFDDAYYAYTQHQQYLECYRSKWGDPSHVLDGTNQTRHLQGMPFAAFALFPPVAADEFMQKEPRLRLVPASKNAYDVCKRGNNKAKGLDFLLRQLGIGWDAVVAVGDGDNDIEMLQKAAVRIAMGNAAPQVLQAANYVAPAVQQDGILWVIDRFFGQQNNQVDSEA